MNTRSTSKQKLKLTFFLLVAAVLAAAAIIAVRVVQPKLDERENANEEKLLMFDAFENEPAAPAVTDLSGNNDYAMITEYIASHPGEEVIYTVELGSRWVQCDAAELTLAAGEYEYAKLSDNLVYLPSLTVLSLPKTDLTADELNTLCEKYPDVSVAWSVEIGGTEYGNAATAINLQAVPPEGLDTALTAMQALPALESISLGSAVSKDDALRIFEAMPGTQIDYSFELFGKTVTSADTELRYTLLELGNDGLYEIERLLPLMPSLTYLKLDSCSIEYAELARFRDDHPDIKTVWRVYFGYYNCLTDTEMILATGYLPENAGDALKYCTEVKYLDIGHNSTFADTEFLRYMPKLKVLILSEAIINTLEPLTGNTSLEWLELSACYRLKDISPLATCTSLKGLNITRATGISDVSALYGLEHMERLYIGNTGLSNAKKNEAAEALPNCWVSPNVKGYGKVSAYYGVGWRLEEDGSYAGWYAEIYEIFHYDSHETDEKYWTHDEGWD